jgi:hypothetical protein
LTAAHDQANTARGQANSAYNQANLAFAAANNSNLTLGGTITGTLNVSQDIVIGGNVYLEGNTTYINVATYSVEDSLIYLASNNNINDIVDIGFMGGKNTSGTYSHTGLARDASDGKWKLFDGLPEEGHVGNVINFNNTYLATLVANVEANTLSVINGVSGNVNFDSGTLFIDSVNNRVGVGTTTPGNTLHVVGSANVTSSIFVGSDGVRLSSDGNGELGVGYGQTPTSRRFSVYNNTTMAFTVMPTGNIGIGTTNPSAKLHVIGGIRYSGIVEYDGGLGARLWVPAQSIGSVTYAGLYGAALTYLAKYDGGWKSFGGGTASALTIDEGRLTFSNSQGMGASDTPITWTNQFTINTSGNVGIGTTDPGYKLDVIGTGTTVARFRASSGTDALVRVIGGDYGTERRARIFLGETDVFGMTIEYDGVNNIGYIGMNSNIDPTGAYSKRIQMSRDNTEVAFMAGNVGIGTTSPSYTLDLLSSTSGYVSRFKSSGNYGGVLSDGGSAGSAGGGYYGVAKNGTRYGIFGVSGAWIGDSTTDVALASDSGNLRFFTNGSVTESMRISTGGSVGIGTITPGTKLHVSGSDTVGRFQSSTGYIDINFVNSTSSTGFLQYDGNNFRVFANSGSVPTLYVNGGAPGSVGIGTANPVVDEKLFVSVTGQYGITVRQSTNNAGLNFYDGLFILNTNNAADDRYASIGLSTNGSDGQHHRAGIRGYRDSAGNFAGKLGLYTRAVGGGWNENLTINAAGNVAIGTTNPQYKLVVSNAGGIGGEFDPTGVQVGGGFGIQAYNRSTSTYVPLQLYGSAIYLNGGNVSIGTTSPQSKLEVATSSGNFSHFGATSTTNGEFTGITLGYRENNSNYRKAAIVQEQIGDNSARGHLHLLVDIANDGGSVVLGDSKLMIHGTTGNVGIGTTSPGSYKLYVQGDQYISGTLTEGSSISLKENIDPITNALDIIAQLTGVTYDRKDGSAKKRAGLIAEQVNKVLPNVVQKDKDGNPSGIQYTNLIAYLVESIKELKAEIDILKSK